MYKLRIVYSKLAELKFLSPLELNKTFQRIIRRSEIPFSLKGVFHPLLKISFPPPLPTGVEGENEIVDIGLTLKKEPLLLCSKLQSNFPSGLILKNIFYSDHLPSVGKIAKMNYCFKGEITNNKIHEPQYENLSFTLASQSITIEVIKDINFMRFNQLLEIIKKYMVIENICRTSMFYLLNKKYAEAHKEIN